MTAHTGIRTSPAVAGPASTIDLHRVDEWQLHDVVAATVNDFFGSDP